jgi:prolyl 4-hydroxylase
MAILKAFSFLTLSLLANAVSSSVQGLHQVPLSDSTCSHPPYIVHLFSKTPLVIYISNFLTPEESSHLQEIRNVQLFNPKHHFSILPPPLLFTH